MDAFLISDRTTVGVLFRQAARREDHVFVRYHDGHAWVGVTWKQMADLILGVAGHLVRRGVVPGDRVLLLAPNSLEWLCCDWAIQTIGGVTVPIYPTTPAAGVQRLAGQCQAVLGIAGDERLAGHLGSLPFVRMDGEVRDWLAAAPEAGDEVERRAAALRPDSLATIVYTSGTTGEPKGVMLAHRNFVDAARSCLAALEVSPADSALSFLPYSHVLERVNGIFVVVMAGASIWLSRGQQRLLDDVAECRPTVVVMVPRVYEKMRQRVLARARRQSPMQRRVFDWALQAGLRRVRGKPSPLQPLADWLVLRRLRAALTGGRLRFFFTGGAPLAREVEEFFWGIGVEILQGWGMTETSAAATANIPGDHRFETVGRPLPGVELRTEDDGEILVRGPGTMLGYFDSPVATAATIEEDWVRTGDIGVVDSDGFLRITDRKKDLIKTAGGKYVAPLQLEAELQQDPLVERVVVLGDRRPYVTALVVPDWAAMRHELKLDGDVLRLAADPRVRAALQARVDLVNQSLGPWETIKRFHVLPHDFSEDEGELTPTLQVRRRVVEERYRKLIDDMYGMPT